MTNYLYTTSLDMLLRTTHYSNLHISNMGLCLFLYLADFPMIDRLYLFSLFKRKRERKNFKCVGRIYNVHTLYVVPDKELQILKYSSAHSVNKEKKMKFMQCFSAK